MQSIVRLKLIQKWRTRSCRLTCPQMVKESSGSAGVSDWCFGEVWWLLNCTLFLERAEMRPCCFYLTVLLVFFVARFDVGFACHALWHMRWKPPPAPARDTWRAKMEGKPLNRGGQCWIIPNSERKLPFSIARVCVFHHWGFTSTVGVSYIPRRWPELENRSNSGLLEWRWNIRFPILTIHGRYYLPLQSFTYFV